MLTAALFFCAASVVSCQKEPTADPAPARAAIRLTAKPADMVRTKSETDVAYASRFVEGDAIGLFAVIRSEAETQADPAASGNYIQNAKFVRQADGSWREEGSKSYYMEQGQVMDLYAYYPYAENADPTALVYDASVAEADFMTARTAGFSERDGEIRLVFRHKLALAEAFVADADKLTDYAVTVQNVRTKAVFSLAAAAQDAEMQSVDAKTASRLSTTRIRAKPRWPPVRSANCWLRPLSQIPNCSPTVTSYRRARRSTFPFAKPSACGRRTKCWRAPAPACWGPWAPA